MQYHRYRVTWKIKDLPFDPKWDYYTFESTTTAEAVKHAKKVWEKEISNPDLNRPALKDVKFVAQRLEY